MKNEKMIKFTVDGLEMRILSDRKGRLGVYSPEDEYQNSSFRGTWKEVVEFIHASWGLAASDQLPEKW